MITNRPDGAFGQLARPLRIGDVTLPNRVFLAPMSGISDAPFRRIALEAGAGMVVSEMIASEQLAIANPEARLRSVPTDIGPHVVQLAGREARWMGEGARAAEGVGADIIDINMGCPAKKVTSGYSGSALMRDLDHALTLIEATVAATSRPVTLKMRLGWDQTTMNAPELAARAENAGVQMLVVHGRTRCQFYDDAADWNAVAAVKAAVSIPVIVNGDIESKGDIVAALAASGADGVMIGRAACGRPWLPGDLAKAASGEAPAARDIPSVLRAAAAHYLAIVEHYGAAVGVRAARKHIGWYLDTLDELGLTVPRSLRARLMQETAPENALRLIVTLGDIEPARAAA